jgi:hypothetical protein
LKKKYFSSPKLPKQQSTSFWSQGILGVKFSNCKHPPTDFDSISKKAKYRCLVI